MAWTFDKITGLAFWWIWYSSTLCKTVTCKAMFMYLCSIFQFDFEHGIQKSLIFLIHLSVLNVIWKYNKNNYLGFQANLWGIFGQWDILLLNLTSIGFTIFFRCLIFEFSFFSNADVSSYWFHDFLKMTNRWVLLFYIYIKFEKPMEVKSRNKMSVPLTKDSGLIRSVIL